MIKDIHFHGSVLMSQDHVNMLARSSLWFMEILELIHSSGFLSRPSFMVLFHSYNISFRFILQGAVLLSLLGGGGKCINILCVLYFRA